jgi:hypothetical protein
MLRRHAAGGPAERTSIARRRRLVALSDLRARRGGELAWNGAACAILLAVWGLSGLTARLMTSSGRPLDVSLRRSTSGWLPALRGEGRVVFHGRINELDD